jgi:outer membrane protein OmpA-like peptidoglycan-associated protein
MIRTSYKRATVIAAAIAAISLGGCTTIDPNTGERVVNRAATGAIIGAVSGAVAGTAAGGDDRRNAVIGAGIGALAGGAVGGYMDRQEQRMRAEMAGTGVEVVREAEDRIKLVMPADITFDTNQSALKPAFQPVLADVARALVAQPATTIDVIGHADSTGPDAYNQALSERRAGSVVSFLAASGVQPVRMGAIGMGEMAPVASNATEDGRAKNRRVEIKLRAITQ